MLIAEHPWCRPVLSVAQNYVPALNSAIIVAHQYKHKCAQIGKKDMKRFFSKIGGVFLRFFLRHWTGMLIVILSLLALLTAHQMWRGGLFLALSLLPQLVTNLILIVAVFAIRHLIHLWKSGAAREILLESLSQGQTSTILPD